MKTPQQGTLSLADLLPSIEGIKIIHHEQFPIDKLPASAPGKEPTADFIDSVRSVGRVIYPIFVINTGRKMIVKDGLRRLKASRILGYPTIPMREVIINSVRGSVLGVMLNTARSENPIAELKMILELVKEGADEKMIHAATHMPISRIRRRLRLQTLHKELRGYAERGRIPTNVAERMAKLSSDEQKRALRLFRKNGKVTGEDVHRIRQKATRAATDSLPMAMFDTPAHEAGFDWKKALEFKLGEALALCPGDQDGERMKLSLSSLLAALSKAA